VYVQVETTLTKVHDVNILYTGDPRDIATPSSMTITIKAAIH